MSGFAGLLGFGLFTALLERAPALRRRAQPFLRRRFATDLVYLATGFGVGGGLALAWFAWASGALAALGAPRPSFAALPAPAQVLLALVGIDLGNYASHLLLHRVGALWELHKVHHSSRQLDWLATFRSHLLEQALRRLLAPALLILAGAPLAAVATASAIFLAFTVFNHANLRLPLRGLEPLLITPRLHRIHHTEGGSECNLGTLLSVWDRLRGALECREPGPEARLGVPGEVESYPQGWLAALVVAPARALGLRAAPGAAPRGASGSAPDGGSGSAPDAASEARVAQRGARVEIGDRGLGAREEGRGEDAARGARVRGEGDDLARRHDGVGRVQAVCAPGLVEADRDAAAPRASVEVVAQELALVAAAILDRERHAEEVADIAQRRPDVQDSPVEEPRAAAVVEEVADVRVAVDHGLRPRLPELV